MLRLTDAAHRLAWLGDHLGELPGSGIIYTLTVAAAEEVTAYLRQNGHPVASYTGRTENADRQQAEDDLLANRVKALVATSALGMGFDKPDLGFVVHLGSPSSPIAYYQQVGRAGRGVQHAEVLLLPGKEDEAIWQYFASVAFPPEEQVRRTLDVLARAERPVSLPALEPMVDLRRTRLETMLKVLDVDGAVKRVKGGWTATGVPWAYDTERYAWVARQREAEQQAMRDYASTTACRMEFLRLRLDDEAAAPCGRCDNCAGARFDDKVSTAALDGARHELGRPGVEVEPRKMWPTGLPAVGVDLKGRIPAGELSFGGRALGRLSDIGWGNRLRPLLAAQAPDAPVPDDVTDAVVTVLADWAKGPGGWASGRPTRRPGRSAWWRWPRVAGRSWSSPSATASPRSAGCPSSGRSRTRRAPTTCGCPRPTALSGCARSTRHWSWSLIWQRRWRRRPGPSCWWTICRTPAGPWPWRRGCCDGPEHRGCFRWSSRFRGDGGVSPGGSGQGYQCHSG